MSEQRSSRRSRRQARGGSHYAGGVSQPPWSEVHNSYPIFEILGAEPIEALHRASLRVLGEFGLEILHHPTRELLRREGAEIDGERVRFPGDMVEEKVALAPAEFTLHSRNSKRSVTIGNHQTVFCAVGGPAFATDIDRGRRAANLADMRDFTRLVHMLNAIHVEGGGAVEPTDLPVETRHLDMYRSFIELTDKPWCGYGLGAFRADDAIDMTAIALGTDRDGLRKRPATLTVINSNSPLRLDGPMSEGLTAFAAAGQPVAATPFTLSGAMAPITVAGASVQQNAEALAMIAIAQCVNAGAPVIYGGFTSNVDMKSGSPAFGTPEYAQSVLIGCQLARRYGVPFRTSNVTACNSVDAQAAYESQMSLWPAILGHAHLVKHCAGWLEGGLTASFEKFILDVEMIQMLAAFLKPPAIDSESVG
ncbi:MAG: trimethylamine methyltransferase family protein, partial [Gammaproteobacteria bacterium]|nr:trimethylamine methyltransferase family protein [Gammaproteobacteria bacterium]